MTRRSFSKEFKLEAVHLADTSGNSSQTARELGVKADMIRRWRKRIDEDGKRAFPGHGNPRDEDFARLQREV
ncbi:MAG: transposase, partial [Bacteroidetes bacterium]|nr:transposase [Bacteroidota bacterium]